MGFVSANLERLCRFNSAESSEFLNVVDKSTEQAVRQHNERKPGNCIAPSSFRCSRKTWFRLRGVEPDVLPKLDYVTAWLANIGSAAHEIIQKQLREYLGDDWISADSYIQSVSDKLEWANLSNYEVDKHGEETQIHIIEPNIKFSVDGLVRFNDKIWLLEIKTMESASFRDLLEPREKDLDQINFYASLLKLQNVFILYVDRVYGSFKCFEHNVEDHIFKEIWDKVEYLQKLAEYDIAPERLPRSDVWCSECIYRKSCIQWG